MTRYADLSKRELALLGCERAREFCVLNRIVPPKFSVRDGRWHLRACGYYRVNRIHICVPLCSRLCTEDDKREWSWPGNTVDREPYGVVLHELGHHVDYMGSARRGTYSGELATEMRRASNEDAISGYCPNDAEWFAEMFRVFAANPMLLKALRPATHELMTERWRSLESVGDERQALGEDCPDRVLRSIGNKINKARRSQYAKQKVW